VTHHIKLGIKSHLGSLELCTPAYSCRQFHFEKAWNSTGQVTAECGALWKALYFDDGTTEVTGNSRYEYTGDSCE
jgi:hypothetical protein